MKKAKITFNGETKIIEITEKFHKSVVNFDKIDTPELLHGLISGNNLNDKRHEKLDILENKIEEELIKCIEINFKVKVNKDNLYYERDIPTDEELDSGIVLCEDVTDNEF